MERKKPTIFLKITGDVAEENRKVLFSYFKKYVNQIGKLFLVDNGTTGKVYFWSLSDAEKVYNAIKEDPPDKLFIKAYWPTPTPKRETESTLSEDSASDVSADQNSIISNMNSENGEQFVDTFGKGIQIYQGTDNKYYLSLEDARKRGLVVMPKQKFSQVLPHNSEKMKQFELYMKGKALEFVKANNFPKDDGLISEIIAKTKTVIFKESNKFVLNDIYKVIVTHKKSNSDIIFLNVLDDERNNFLEEVHRKSSESSVVQKPVKHLICAALFCETWYRAKIINTFPLKVCYIDFGNIETVNPTKLHELPKELASKPSLAIEVKIDHRDAFKGVVTEEEYYFKPTKFDDSSSTVCIGIFRKSKLEFKNRSSGSSVENTLTRIKSTIDSEDVLDSNSSSKAHMPLRKPHSSPTPKQMPSMVPNQSKHNAVETDKFLKQKDVTPSFKQHSKLQSKEVAPREDKNSKLEANLKQPKSFKQPVINKRPCVIDKINTQGFFYHTDVINDSSFVAYIISDDFMDELAQLEEIDIDTNKVQPLKSYKVGDLVVICYENSEAEEEQAWARAVIVNITDSNFIHCAVIDYGKYQMVEEVYPIPDEFKNVCEFSFVCNTNKTVIQDIFKNSHSDYTFNISTPNVCSINTGKKSYEVKVEKWDPVGKHSAFLHKQANNKTTTYKYSPKYFKLNNNDLIAIVKEGNGYFFVKTKKLADHLKEINKEIESVEEEIIEKPELNQMVLTRRKDSETLHRAVIDKISNNEVTANFIDYGVIETVPLHSLWNVNKKLSEMESAVIKTPYLCGHTEQLFGKKSLEYIETCIKNRTKFIATFVGNDAVDLRHKEEGFSLTKKLSELDPAIVTYDDIKLYCCGSTKDTFICVNTENLKSGIVSLFKNDEESVKILTEIDREIEKYIETETNLYEPNLLEVCLAEFDGAWFRATVIDKKKADYTVYYIDYGNEAVVTTKKIRKISSPLLKYPGMALCCALSITGVPEVSEMPDDIFDKIKFLLIDNEYEAIIKPFKSENNKIVRFIAEFPHVNQIILCEDDDF